MERGSEKFLALLRCGPRPQRRTSWHAPSLRSGHFQAVLDLENPAPIGRIAGNTPTTRLACYVTNNFSQPSHKRNSLLLIFRRLLARTVCPTGGVFCAYFFGCTVNV